MRVGLGAVVRFTSMGPRASISDALQHAVVHEIRSLAAHFLKNIYLQLRVIAFRCCDIDNARGDSCEYIWTHMST